MNKIILLISGLFLASCDAARDPIDQNAVHDTICIDGVTYVYFRAAMGNRGYGYMSVKLDTDSKVILCSDITKQ